MESNIAQLVFENFSPQAVTITTQNQNFEKTCTGGVWKQPSKMGILFQCQPIFKKGATDDTEDTIQKQILLSIVNLINQIKVTIGSENIESKINPVSCFSHFILMGQGQTFESYDFPQIVLGQIKNKDNKECYVLNDYNRFTQKKQFPTTLLTQVEEQKITNNTETFGASLCSFYILLKDILPDSIFQRDVFYFPANFKIQIIIGNTAQLSLQNNGAKRITVATGALENTNVNLSFEKMQNVSLQLVDQNYYQQIPVLELREDLIKINESFDGTQNLEVNLNLVHLKINYALISFSDLENNVLNLGLLKDACKFNVTYNAKPLIKCETKQELFMYIKSVYSKFCYKQEYNNSANINNYLIVPVILDEIQNGINQNKLVISVQFEANTSKLNCVVNYSTRIVYSQGLFKFDSYNMTK